MLAALCEHLIEKPRLYRDEMVVFLYDEFEVLVSVHSIGRALASIKWTKKVIRRIANERNTELRDFLHAQVIGFSLVPTRICGRVWVRQADWLQTHWLVSAWSSTSRSNPFPPGS